MADINRRLLIIIGTPYRGGAEEYALKIARRARERGYAPALASTATAPMQSLIDDFAALGAPHFPVELVAPDTEWAERGNRMGLAWTFLKSCWLVLRARPRVAFVVLGWPNRTLGTLLALTVLRVPTVVVFQLVRQRHAFSAHVLRAYAYARNRQKWVAVSKNNRDLVCQSFNCAPADIRLIYNGTRRPDPPADRNALRDEVRAELGLTATQRLILAVGRIHRQKGIFALAEALPELRRSHPEAVFVWLGDGTDRDQFKRKLAANGCENCIRLLGHRTDVSRFLWAADLFVLPSLYEGFPFSVLEAAAHGVPIVTSDASSIPEVIEDGVHGRLVKAGDATSLRDVLLWALLHPDDMAEMGRAASQRADAFSEDAMLRETIDALDEAAV